MKGFLEDLGRLIPKRLWWVFLLVVVLRIPSLFEPYSYGDEGIYLVLGQAIRKGLVFYRDMHDNKPPFLYMMAGIAGSLFWFRVILAGWYLFNTWIVWKLSESMFKSEKVAFWASMIFGFASSFTILEGNIANGELFMIMPFCAAVWLVYEGVKKKREKNFFWTGVLASVGFLFKVPIGFDFAGLGLWVLVLGLAERKRNLKRLGLRLGGMAVFLAYYSLKGAGEPYLRSALMQNIGYLSSWSGGAGGGLLASPLVQRGFLALGLSGGLVAIRKKIGDEVFGLGLWLVWGLFGALLSERPYPHYMIEVVPSLALLSGLMVSKKWRKRGVFVLVLKTLGDTRRQCERYRERGQG